MKRMLINATQEEELRMAMVDGQRLYDLNIELPAGERKKANIYKGQITRLEPSLEAAFVDYGAERHGFLPLKEISSEYFVQDVDSGSKPNIKEVLKEGQDIVIQIDKEERGNKGAALTTFVSLAGRFIVLKPNKSRSGGVSRRIVGEDRDLARKSLRDVEVPKDMSVILRTAGIDRSAEELEWDLNNLLAIWEAILKVVVERPSPFLIYREGHAVVRALRDYLTNEIGEILIDDDATHKEALEFVEQVMPHNLRKLKHYIDPVPLFTRYQIESQIESAFAHAVTLPSGGSLVIDHTEALVSIDINSARATKGGDIEATALNTNLEAADEIGRQLRLRDLGGLVVIDFIDMGPQRNQREVENRLREAVRQDRARVQIGKITRFGLLEMSRQRLRPSLGESSYLTCPRCSGIGHIRSVESLALTILRIIGEEARKERTAKVIAQLPVEVATYLLNEKRDWVQNLESRNDTQVILVANAALETPHYQVRRVRDDQVELAENTGTSYSLAEIEEESEMPQSMQEPRIVEQAAIATVTPTVPVPKHKPRKKSAGLWATILAFFQGSSKVKKKKPRRQQKTRAKSDTRRRGGQRSRRRGERAAGDRSSANRGKSAAKKSAAKKSGAKKSTKKTASADAPRKAKSGRGKSRVDANKDQQPATRKKSAAEGNAEASDDSRQGTKKAASKRRSRGGRRRRRASGTDEKSTNNAEQKTDGRARIEAEETTPGERQDPVSAAVASAAATTAAVAIDPGKQDAMQPAAESQAENSEDGPSREKSSDFTDTEPQLPAQVVKEALTPQQDRSEATPAATPKAPAAEEVADSERLESPPTTPKESSTSGNGEAKSGGRLLPWEPAKTSTAPAEPTSGEDAGEPS